MRITVLCLALLTARPCGQVPAEPRVATETPEATISGAIRLGDGCYGKLVKPAEGVACFVVWGVGTPQSVAVTCDWRHLSGME